MIGEIKNPRHEKKENKTKEKTTEIIITSEIEGVK